MSIAPGYTVADVREFVHEYEVQPHGTRAAWLAARGERFHSRPTTPAPAPTVGINLPTETRNQAE